MKTVKSELAAALLAGTALLSGCAVVPPANVHADQKLSETKPVKASKLLVVLDVSLEVQESLGGPIWSGGKVRQTYLDFAQDLQAELAKAGLSSDVITQAGPHTAPVPGIYSHVATLKLRSMTTSSMRGDSGRYWWLTTTQQGVFPDQPAGDLYRTAFSSDFERCYLTQITVNDNKAQCRRDMTGLFVNHLRKAGVL